MRKRRWWLFFVVPPLLVLFTLIGGGIVMLLWNWLGPQLFGWRQITFWQAWGLLAMCRILFGGLGVRGPVRSKMRERMAERMAERMEHMTPEEREAYRERMRGLCGEGPRGSDSNEKPTGGT